VSCRSEQLQFGRIDLLGLLLTDLTLDAEIIVDVTVGIVQGVCHGHLVFKPDRLDQMSWFLVLGSQ
jgi:hypothetical protein